MGALLPVLSGNWQWVAELPPVVGFVYLHDRHCYSSNFLKMEQNDTNKESVATTIKKEISFWDRPSTRVLIFIGIILVGLWYFTKWIPRQNCAGEVRFVPATDSRTPNAANPRDRGEVGLAEHYLYNNQKFATKGEAISYCTSNK